MRVRIDEITGPMEAIFALGLRTLLIADGVTVEGSILPAVPPAPADPVVAAVRAAVTPDPKAAKGKPGTKPNVVSQIAGSSAPVEKTEVRKSNRERVLDYLRLNPGRTSAQIATGVALDDSQVSNLLWNSKKANEVRKDESVVPTRWSVV